MPRRSSGGRASARAPVRNAPQPAKQAPPPATAQAQPRGGGLGAAIADGMAWGTGISIAHRAMDAVMGPRSVEVVHSQASPAPAPEASSMVENTHSKDLCANNLKAFQDCVNTYSSDISKCQFYLDMLNECRRSSSATL